MSFDLTLTPAVKTQCKNCHACCMGLIVDLDEEDLILWEESGLLEELLESTEIDFENPWGHNRVIKQRDDGSCIFLVNGLCTIYQVRPNVCRDFEYLGLNCKSLRKRCGLDDFE